MSRRLRDIGLVIKAFHPQFLLLTPACFSLGLALVLWENGTVDFGRSLIAFIGALAAHSSVNGCNEYFDYRSGLDGRTKKTPFSGGSGVLQARPDLSLPMLFLIGISLLVTIIVGLGFVWEYQNMWLGVVGVFGLALVVAYTPWLTHNPWLCLVAPGLGFGFFMIGGVYFVLAGPPTLAAWMGILIVFFLVNNLLLLNQYPDVEADKTVDRAHFPIVYGLKSSTVVYGIFTVAAAGVLAYAIVSGLFPYQTALGYIPLAFGLVVLGGALKYAHEIHKLLFFMGLNVAVVLATPIMIALGFWLAD